MAESSEGDAIALLAEARDVVERELEACAKAFADTCSLIRKPLVVVHRCILNLPTEAEVLLI